MRIPEASSAHFMHLYHFSRVRIAARVMNDITRILNTIEEGQASPDELLNAVYNQLRKMAAGKMMQERIGHTLQATALVHEAWMRLGDPEEQRWENRAHFFGAASEAMRRILVDHARKKNSEKRGSGGVARELSEQFSEQIAIELSVSTDELLAVDEALCTLAIEDPKAAELVKLRYFVGMTMTEAADALGMKKRSAEALWTYAKVALRRTIKG